MSRTLSIVGLPKDFINISSKLGLQFLQEQPFKEYFYSDGYSMKEYVSRDQVVYEEFEQACPWNGGPDLFLGLREKSSKTILCSWTLSQMGMKEHVVLPEGYEKKDILLDFIKEHNGPNCFGYCALHVKISNENIQLLQYESKNDGVKIPLLQKEHGPLIRDWLSQEGFSVVELDN